MTQVPLKKPLTDDELNGLAQAMNTKYKSALDGRLFSAEAEQKDDGVYVKVLLKNQDSSFYYPVEARVKYKHEELGVSEAALFLIDYIDTYFEEFLISQEIYLPIDWADYEYEAVDFQIKGQIFNKKLDQMADELLGANSL
jgi:hypothetical protein